MQIQIQGFSHSKWYFYYFCICENFEICVCFFFQPFSVLLVKCIFCSFRNTWDDEETTFPRFFFPKNVWWFLKEFLMIKKPRALISIVWVKQEKLSFYHWYPNRLQKKTYTISKIHFWGQKIKFSFWLNKCFWNVLQPVKHIQENHFSNFRVIDLNISHVCS